MQHMDDTAMLTALKSGDLKAYQYFFMKYYKPLCLKARLMLNSMDESEQLVQQLFVQVWEDQSYMDIEHSVGGYFYRLVHNSCVNLVKKESSSGQLSTDHGLLLMQRHKWPLPAFQGPVALELEVTESLLLIYPGKRWSGRAAQLISTCVNVLKTFCKGALKELRLQIKL